MQILGRHYDIVLNGIELGGGSIRIHDAIQQEHVFKNILKVFSHNLNLFGQNTSNTLL